MFTPGCCICLPSRGHGDQLVLVVHDLLAKATRDDTMVSIAVDDDDPTVEDLVIEGCRVIVSKGPRPATLGDKYDRCFEAMPDAALYVPFGDDAKFADAGYDVELMNAIGKFPDDLGMVTHPGIGPGFFIGFGIGGGMARLFGTIGVPLFPYWWEETWWNEVGRLSGRMLWRENVKMIPWRAADVAAAQAMSQDDKTTTGIRDVAFWARFFDETRPIRIGQAKKLMESDPAFRREQIEATWPVQCRVFEAANSKLRDPLVAAHYERNLKGLSGVAENRYLELKKKAQELVRTIQEGPA